MPRGRMPESTVQQDYDWTIGELRGSTVEMHSLGIEGVVIEETLIPGFYGVAAYAD